MQQNIYRLSITKNTIYKALLKIIMMIKKIKLLLGRRSTGSYYAVTGS